jgi:hypothetical protein
VSNEEERKKWSWQNAPSKTPPVSPLPKMAANLSGSGGTAARREDGAPNDQSDSQKFTDAAKHKAKFPLEDSP